MSIKEQFIQQSKGKTIAEVEWDEEGDGGGYWVLTFTDGSEVCIRLMAEIVMEQQLEINSRDGEGAA